MADMSRTQRFSRHGTVMRVTKRDDGTFDLVLNRLLSQASIPMAALEKVLCVQFGYCQDEFAAIVSELDDTGRAERSW
jgi:hypothetical protein